MGKILLVTGGQRSGKSSYAEKLAWVIAGCGGSTPVYMATARVWDDEFAKRVERHKASRSDEWTNIEEEKELSRHNVTGRIVVIDCVTLWVTNFFFDENTSDNGENDKNTVQKVLKRLKDEFDKFTAQDAVFIFVTNEIGLGGISDNKLQRQFVDLQGWINQYIASKADEVILMISGIAMKIK